MGGAGSTRSPCQTELVRGWHTSQAVLQRVGVERDPGGGGDVEAVDSGRDCDRQRLGTVDERVGQPRTLGAEKEGGAGCQR